jgi:hypothetical protein
MFALFADGARHRWKIHGSVVWEVEIAFVEWVVGNFSQSADLQQVRRFEKVTQLFLSNMNFTIVHKSSGDREGKMFINIVEFHGLVEEFWSDVTRETFTQLSSNQTVTSPSTKASTQFHLFRRLICLLRPTLTSKSSPGAFSLTLGEPFIHSFINSFNVHFHFFHIHTLTNFPRLPNECLEE